MKIVVAYNWRDHNNGRVREEIWEYRENGVQKFRNRTTVTDVTGYKMTLFDEKDFKTFEAAVDGGISEKSAIARSMR